MSESNLDRVRRWFARWNAGEREFGEDEVDPDAVIVSRFFPEPQRGFEGAQRWLREIDDYFERWTVEGDRWIDAGERIGVLGEIRLRGRGSGVAFTQPCGWLFEIREGRLRRLETYIEEPEEALRAAGLLP